MICNIVIPTYQSQEGIGSTLRALYQQKIPVGWEIRVIISDDGSTDETVGRVESVSQESSWEHVIVRGDHVGAATARNRGLAKVSGGIVLLLGSDILLRPSALQEHLLFHQQDQNPRHAALGMVKWDPRINPTPLMEWMTHGGQQNDFDALLGKKQADPRHFAYASHLSLKHELILDIEFPVDYETYGWEDLDFGRMLADEKGCHLYVLHKAVGLHAHYYDASSINQRQYSLGLGVSTYQARYPQEGILPSRGSLSKLKQASVLYTGANWVLQRHVSRIAARKSRPRVFAGATTAQFWKGVYKLSTFWGKQSKENDHL